MNPEMICRTWSRSLPENDPLRAELPALSEAEKEERFGSVIAFGTAGLRGVYGAGTSRMNRYTVARATKGIADYILASGEDPSRGVALAYDGRYHSAEFAYLAAVIFAKCGIPSYIFPSLRPTPELSFAIRRLGTVSGINMTASHNPKEYNGYKVYWKDGAQISGAVGDGMSEAIGALEFFDGIQFEAARGTEEGDLAFLRDPESPVTILGEEMDEAYYEYVLSLSLRKGDELDRSVRVSYTPLHGAGAIPVREVLARAGYPNISFEEAQMVCDPDFTTAPFPNPEDPRAFERLEETGRACGAELLIATDPDADRMAIEILQPDGTYRFLNGNQTGALLIRYMAEAEDALGILHPEGGPKPVMIKSIVTGDMGRAVCDDFGIRTAEALTGFKNICGRIPSLEQEGYRVFFAYEESIGCAPDAGVRDKDGIAAALLVTEMAAYYKKQGTTIADVLAALYEKYGYYAEKQVSMVLTGNEGKERIGRIMDAFRAAASEGRLPEAAAPALGTEDGSPENARGAVPVPEKVIDYLHGYEDIPASDVLKYDMPGDSWFAMRPSGTEPKLKFYFYAHDMNEAESERILTLLSKTVMGIAEAIE